MSEPKSASTGATMRRPTAAEMLSKLKVGDAVKYIPPWQATEGEIEHGKVVEIRGNMVYVRYEGSRTPISTHPANLTFAESEKLVN